MGRDGRLAMTEFRTNIQSDSKTVTLTAEAKTSLGLMLDRLESGRPRELPCSFESQPVLVFTDGAIANRTSTPLAVSCLWMVLLDTLPATSQMA